MTQTIVVFSAAIIAFLAVFVILLLKGDRKVQKKREGDCSPPVSEWYDGGDFFSKN